MKDIIQIADFVLENVLDQEDLNSLSKLDLSIEEKFQTNKGNYYDLKQLKEDVLNNNIEKRVSLER